jgi:hypothetical protein
MLMSDSSVQSRASKRPLALPATRIPFDWWKN